MTGSKLVILALLCLLPCGSLGEEQNVTVASIDVVNVEACTQAVLVSGIRLTGLVNDSRKYVECVGIGLGVERSCVLGSVFDITKMGCVLDEASLVSGGEVNNSTNSTESPLFNTTVSQQTVSQVRAMPATVEHEQVIQVAPRVVNMPINVSIVSKTETWCRNGGESHGGSCICLADFTGANCETELSRWSNWSVVGHLINDTFDFDAYSRLNLVNESHQDGYKTTIEHLIESIWRELSGEDTYMRSFNYSSLLNQTHNLGRRLHRLSLYAQRDLLSFELNFKLYTKSLDKLADYFVASNESVRSDAVRFTNEWIQANNLTESTSNETNVVVNVTDSAHLRASILCRTVMSRIKERLNVTRDVAHDFYVAYLNRSHVDFDLHNYTHVLANLTERNWNAVVNYGFWRVTRRLSGIEHFGEFGTPVVVRKRSVREKDGGDSAVFNASQTDVDLSLRAFVDSRSFDRRFSPKIFRKFLSDLDK